jgi:DNA polymerase-1
MNYLLIDGNNLGCRHSFANAALTNTDGVFSGCHFGFAKSIIKFKKLFPEYKILVAWDNKSTRRCLETQEAVENKVVPDGYKANRKDRPEPLKLFMEQSEYLMKGIDTLGVAQIKMNGVEADDIIASYCKNLPSDSDIIIVTSDNDYYQLLCDNVKILDDMKGKEITKDSFIEEFGFTPDKFVHYGAIMGDDGDNIYGVPSWGDVNARKAIVNYGDIYSMIKEYEDKYSGFRKLYPDLDESNISLLTSIETAAKKKPYIEVDSSFPYTGVALALEQGKLKMPKKDIFLLLFQKRLHLALSLKKMDVFDVPEIIESELKEELFYEYLNYYDITTIRL